MVDTLCAQLPTGGKQKSGPSSIEAQVFLLWRLHAQVSRAVLFSLSRRLVARRDALQSAALRCCTLYAVQ